MSNQVEEEYMNRQHKYSSAGQQTSESLQGKRWAKEIRDWVLTTGIVFIIMALLNMFVINISTVKGQSMQPTLWEGEKLLINKIALSFTHPKRGDIVVLHDPSTGEDRKDYLVKRVIGIPGDTVEVREHKLYVNGKLKEEPYTDTEIQDPDFAPIVVENDSYFVMGDNRHAAASKDSRYFGSVNQDKIVGRAAFVWWPLSRLDSL
jgi:signal peptidase I